LVVLIQIDAVKTYTYLMGQLEEYEHGQVKAWAESIEATSNAKLKNPVSKPNTNPKDPS
jgi:hypothetical protein